MPHARLCFCAAVDNADEFPSGRKRFLEPNPPSINAGHDGVGLQGIHSEQNPQKKLVRRHVFVPCVE
jgi:hypothetical protein